MGRLATIALAGASLALALASIAFGLPGLGRRPMPEGALASAADGAMRISSSNADRAILSSENLAPGDTVYGRVLIGNAGKGLGELVLAQRRLSELPGPNGGGLAGVLRLTVTDLSGRSDAVVYSGSLAAMEDQEVAVLHPGGRRLYGFAATLPAWVQDNGLAGAGISLDYRWVLVGPDEDEPCPYPFNGDGEDNAIVGSAGGDRLNGRGGEDRLRGSAGADCLDGGPGRDVLVGEWADDRIDARDGSADTVDCGLGREDVALVDRFDSVRGCEILR